MYGPRIESAEAGAGGTWARIGITCAINRGPK
jgi:hypothetical protein